MQKLTNKALETLRVYDDSLSLLKANDYIAEMIRDEMKQRKILLLNLVSSSGSGKHHCGMKQPNE